MSEFCCRNGHFITSRDNGVCPECGGRIATMDGYSRSELRRMEEIEEEIVCEEEEDEHPLFV